MTTLIIGGTGLSAAADPALAKQGETPVSWHQPADRQFSELAKVAVLRGDSASSTT